MTGKESSYTLQAARRVGYLTQTGTDFKDSLPSVVKLRFVPDRRMTGKESSYTLQAARRVGYLTQTGTDFKDSLPSVVKLCFSLTGV